MDYKCECGAHFDIYDVDNGHRDVEIESNDEIVAYFFVKCPDCGKEIHCSEIFTYSKTEIDV